VFNFGLLYLLIGALQLLFVWCSTTVICLVLISAIVICLVLCYISFSIFDCCYGAYYCCVVLYMLSSIFQFWFYVIGTSQK